MSSPNNNNQIPQKKSKGRQKIKMEKIQNQKNLNAAFSKRRGNLFKKASEICTRCGADAVVVVFSPANKAYCFGHPSVEAVTERYISESSNTGANDDNNNDPIDALCKSLMEANRDSNLRELNTEVTTLERQMSDEKTREKELEAMKRMGRAQKWFPPPLEGLNYAQLCALKDSVLKFKNEFNDKVQSTMQDNSSYNLFVADHKNVGSHVEQYGHKNIAESSSAGALSFLGGGINVASSSNVDHRPFDPSNLGSNQVMSGSNILGNNQLPLDSNTSLRDLHLDPNNVGNNRLPFNPNRYGLGGFGPRTF